MQTRERSVRTNGQKASTLIVALGMLAALAMLAFIFSGVMRSERNVSRAYVDQVRSKIVAMSGMEKARAVLMQRLATPIPGAGSQPPDYSIVEGQSADLYGAGAPAFSGDPTYAYPDVPIPYAKFPAFRVPLPEQAAGAAPGFVSIPSLDNEIDVDNPNASSKEHLFGASGFLPSTYSSGYDFYSIKLISGNGRVYVNGSDKPGTGTPTPLAANQLRLLNTLGATLHRTRASRSKTQLSDITAGLRARSGGTKITELDNKMLGLGDFINVVRVTVLKRNLTTLRELYDYLEPATRDKDIRVLSNYLTCFAWVDDRTLDSSKMQHAGADDPNIQFYSQGAIAYGPQPGEMPDQPFRPAGLTTPSARLFGGFADMGRTTTLSGPQTLLARCPSSSPPPRPAPYVPPPPPTPPPPPPPPPPVNCSSRLVSADSDNWLSAGPLFTEPNPDVNRSTAVSTVGTVLQPRAPIDINTASWEVLASVFDGVSARYMVRTGNASSVMMGNGWTASSTVTVPTDEARRIADEIITWRALLSRKPGDTSIPSGLPVPMSDYRLTPIPAGRGYGFATWADFDTFVDTRLAEYLCQETAATMRQRYQVTPDVSTAGDLAFLNMLKAHANPNSRINKFNPDRTTGAVYGDTDKADLTVWTTEFCFQSGGYYELEVTGRVVGPANWIGGKNLGGEILGETVARAVVQMYDVQRLTTQSDFVNTKDNTPGTSAVTLQGVKSYPENLDDLTPGGAAQYDGSLMLETTDTGIGNAPAGVRFFAHYTGKAGGTMADDFGPGAAGFVDSDVSLVESPTGSTGGVPDRTGVQSDLFVDGVFAHETRRYGNYNAVTRSYNVPGVGSGNVAVYGSSLASANSSQDEYLRNRDADSKISMTQGTVEMWVKPTWGAADFSSDLTNGYANPGVESDRVFFSVGEGTNPAAYYNVGRANTYTSVSDNRLVLFAGWMPDGVSAGNTYVGAFHGTRLVQEYNNWLNGGPVSTGYMVMHRDINAQNGYYQVNGVPMTRDPSFTSVDPTNWEYPGLWHHLVFGWSVASAGVYNANLLVDGRAFSPSSYIPQGRRSPNAPASLGAAASLFIGNNRFGENLSNGFPCTADCTIDAVKVYNSDIFNGSPAYAPPPPDRYKRTGRFTGIVGPTSQPVGARILSLSWTASFPNFNTMASSLGFTLKGSGRGGTWTWGTATNGGLTESTTSQEGRGMLVSTRPSIDAGSELQLTVDFNARPVGGRGYVSASPILDDVTVLLTPTDGCGRFAYFNVE